MDRPELADLAREVGRVADRLRSMSDVRLAQRMADHTTRATAALDLAQLLADAAQGVEERASAEQPRWRVVPDLGVFALGDQVAVTGHDLVAALAGLAPDDPVWSRTGRRAHELVLADVAEAVRALRHAL